ncbi:hypothetical protein HPB50_013059 [Hyalomma asiaticum]|uniref:Uncharacterized protein n=1 Tax=Hyalomma asiaticum TaxID=266040 RepID=A0ACB7SN08_HYAAI|nr:hypothetical protein HPB50_013059 [Hyalomma asiaticum]
MDPRESDGSMCLIYLIDCDGCSKPGQRHCPPLSYSPSSHEDLHATPKPDCFCRPLQKVEAARHCAHPNTPPLNLRNAETAQATATLIHRCPASRPGLFSHRRHLTMLPSRTDGIIPTDCVPQLHTHHRAYSDHIRQGSSGSTAVTQSEIVVTRSIAAKLRAARHANTLGNTSMSQSAETAPPCAKSSASTVKSGAHADAATTWSVFPVMAAEGAPYFSSCAPPVPTSSRTASLEGDSSEQVDSTASPGNICNTLPPESSCNTIGTDCKPASAVRPHNDLISLGIQLPPGTLPPKLPLYDLLAAIVSTARLSPKASHPSGQSAHSLVFLKTHSPLTANLVLCLTHLQLHAASSDPERTRVTAPAELTLGGPAGPGMWFRDLDRDRDRVRDLERLLAADRLRYLKRPLRPGCSAGIASQCSKLLLVCIGIIE